MHPTCPLIGILLLSLSLRGYANAAAVHTPDGAIRKLHELTLSARVRAPRTIAQWGAWASFQRHRLSIKYGSKDRLMKRGSGMNLLTNQNADSSYFGSLVVGTPPVSYNVILDTGSSDFWLATTEALNHVDGNDPDDRFLPGYNPEASSSYVPLNRKFSITYGSGGAAGVLGKEIVQMAGFTVQDQVMAVVSNMTEDMLSVPVSGLLGLGFPSIATSREIPFWLNVAAQPGVLDDAIMAFHLTRYLNDFDARNAEPGGSFIFGGVNSSLFSGEIDFQDIPGGRVGYWIQTLTSIFCQGTPLQLPLVPQYAAIDTGTTLVGGPPTIIQQLYQSIPGSERGIGDYDGYYTYPCATTVSISLTFGNSSISWPISPDDFKLAQLSSDTCLGAFFEFPTTNPNGPSWIIGDTFLKNVYSVFRAAPKPAVGFAQLSDLAKDMNGRGGALPTPTYMDNGATVTAQDGLARPTSGGSPLYAQLLTLFSALISAIWLAAS